MKTKLVAVGLLSLALAGCGGLTKVDGNGEPMGELKWPKIEKSTTDHHKGTYGDMARISKIEKGTTREQIYELVGVPHFSEGFHVNEWNYLFNFKKADGQPYSCLFKILFDRHLLVSHTYWHEVDGSVCPPSATPVVAHKVVGKHHWAHKKAHYHHKPVAKKAVAKPATTNPKAPVKPAVATPKAPVKPVAAPAAAKPVAPVAKPATPAAK